MNYSGKETSYHSAALMSCLRCIQTTQGVQPFGPPWTVVNFVDGSLGRAPWSISLHLENKTYVGLSYFCILNNKGSLN